MTEQFNIGKMHTNEQIVIKLKALIKECKWIYRINKARRESDGYAWNLEEDMKFDSMNQLATELERELKEGE